MSCLVPLYGIGLGVLLTTCGGPKPSSDPKVAAARSDTSLLLSAVQVFRLDCDRYPSQADGLEALRREPKGVKTWRGPYLQGKVPKDPWGHPYIYRFPHRNGKPTILSYGSDGVPGGKGSAEDITAS